MNERIKKQLEIAKSIYEAGDCDFANIGCEGDSCPLDAIGDCRPELSKGYAKSFIQKHDPSYFADERGEPLEEFKQFIVDNEHKLGDFYPSLDKIYHRLVSDDVGKKAVTTPKPRFITTTEMLEQGARYCVINDCVLYPLRFDLSDNTIKFIDIVQWATPEAIVEKYDSVQWSTDGLDRHSFVVGE
jgi:hypothetical protein